MAQRTTRRAFLQRSAVGGGGLLVLSNAFSARSYAANEKLNLALIGVGGRGQWFVDTLPRLENVVAFCDVNESKAAAAYKQYPDTPRFDDFRKMLDAMGKQIDAVVVATPDHTHAVAAAAAMKAGKHVFCEKPLTGCVWEARALREIAAAQKVATQMGNQGSSTHPFRHGVEVIQDGLLGDVREVFVFKDSGGADRRETPTDTPPVPPYLKWDLWLGPAKARPFHPQWLGWSQWREFGTGEVGMWGSHSTYLAFTALRIGDLWQTPPATPPPPPARVRAKAETSGVNRLSFPRWEAVHLDVPARGALPPVTLHWINGAGAPGWRPRIEEALGHRLDWGDAGEKKWADHAGALIVGSKGRMHLTGHNASFDLQPAADFQGIDLNGPPQRLPTSRGHEADWLAACRGGPLPLSTFGLSGPYMEMLLLINVATQFEAELEYDPSAGHITNHEEADRALRRDYRDGWSL